MALLLFWFLSQYINYGSLFEYGGKEALKYRGNNGSINPRVQANKLPTIAIA